MLHYAAVKVSDLERSGAFYDSILAPLGWRRQEAPADSVSWGLIKAEFFISSGRLPRPGYGPDLVPGEEHPRCQGVVRVRLGRMVESRSPSPAAAPSFGPGNYACRLNDPDGYLVEVCVSHDR